MYLCLCWVKDLTNYVFFSCYRKIFWLSLSFATFLFLFLSFFIINLHVVTKTKCSFYDRYMHHCSFTAEDAMLQLVCQRAKIQDGHSIMVRCTFLMVLIVLLSALKIMIIMMFLISIIQSRIYDYISLWKVERTDYVKIP